MTGQTSAFDAKQYKDATRRQWDSAAEAWHRWRPVLDDWLGRATETMLDMAHVGEGARVLDVAAGSGEQTLMIARRVGPEGRVLATDLAPNFVAICAEVAREEGLANVEARVMDAENLEVPDESFDAVISRLGIMFFPHLGQALAGMRRALKPGGHIGAIVFSTPDKSPFFSVPISIIRRRTQMPPPAPGQPGPFSLGSPGVLENAYREAGFRDIECRPISAPLRLASLDELLRFQKEAFGVLREMISKLDESEQAATWEEISREMSKFVGPNGFESPCELLIGVGVK